MSKICRICLKSDSNQNSTYVSLNSLISGSDCLSIKDQLLACIPELSINVAPDAFICNSCVNALQITYEFWSMCLQTEQKIRNFMQKNTCSSNTINLNSLIEFERTGLLKLTESVLSNKTDCELIEVEHQLPDELHVEPDLIDIKYIVPVLSEIEEPSVKVEELNTDDRFNLKYFENCSNQNEEIIEVIIKNDNSEENLENEAQFNSHICYECGYCFSTQGSLKRHMNLHLKPKSNWNRTNNIKRSILPLKRLNEHLSGENAKKSPHMCDVCGKCFRQKATLKSHMNVHNGGKLFRCEICDKHFNFKNNLHRHMLMHKSGTRKRFKCNICEKLFTRKEHLSKHMISHTDEVPYQCLLCKKLFKYKDSLRGHLKYHNGEKRFRCEICGNGFIRRDNLHVHIRTVHADEKSFECGTCNEEFIEKCEYEEHKKLHIGRMYYKCKTCDKLFKRKQSLRIHSNIHLNVKPYKCSICNQTFSQKGTLTHHIRTHTGEKPFTCFVCERSFTQKATLRNHLSRHRSKNGVLVKDEPVEETKCVEMP